LLATQAGWGEERGSEPLAGWREERGSEPLAGWGGGEGE